MILALNANAALDRILFIDRFTPKTAMRASHSVDSVGGKGLDTALVLHTLGAPVQALTFLAGRNGQALLDLLTARGVPTEAIWVEGETRLATILVETDFNRHSHVFSRGYRVTPADCERLLARLESLAGDASWAVLAGTLPDGAPADFYAHIITRLHAQRVPVLIDAYGPAMRNALPAQPEIVKLNQDEFCATFDLPTPDDWPAAARAVMTAFGLRHLVITCGKDGLLALTPAGVFQAGSPPVAEVNAAGAGDAVSAALVQRFSAGDSWAQALPWAAAVSAAVVLTEGTAECDPAAVAAIYPHAWVKRLCD